MLCLLNHLIPLLVLVVCVSCRPQCLDFRAPFQPSSALGFCSEYSDYACCDSQNDNRLQEEYNYIKSKGNSRLWGRCEGFVKQILCQRCSPYAARIFGAESTGKPRGFPGLCRGFCNEFYDKCRSFLWLLDPEFAGSQVFASKSGICNRVALDNATYCYPDIKTNTVLTVASVSPASAGPSCLCLQKINSRQQLAMPLWAGSPDDGSGRLFVIEQLGRIRIYNTNTQRWNFGCFLDLTLKARVAPLPADERGALGMAFHPNFANNGRFFVFYTAIRWPWEPLPSELQGRPFFFEDKIIISEWRVSRLNPNVADIFSEKRLLTIYQPFLNHNGGTILFGDDGYLYAFFGDGGGAGDPMQGAQDKALLYGKVIRVDVDSDPSKPYTIPDDNPFVNDSNARPEIYALGMRNPWRCTMDRGERGTGNNRGRILCGDVGQYVQEEIDIIKPGANYGWSSREGYECFNQDTCGNIGPEELPIFAYNHTVGLSITGGHFYRGCENPALEGLYVYGDYINKKLYTLNETDEGWVNEDLNLCGSDICQGGLQGSLSDNIISFAEDGDGEIYVMTTKSSNSFVCDGSIYKMIDPATRNDPSTCSADLTKSQRIPLPKRSIIFETAHKALSLFL